MSAKTHQILTTIGAVLFTVCMALLQTPSVTTIPHVQTSLQVAVAVLGALGFTVARPLFGNNQPKGDGK